MNKIYIELGTYNGDTIAAMLKTNKDLNQVIGFEPIPHFYKMAANKFRRDSRVTIHNVGVGIEDQQNVKLYLDNQTTFIGSGSSLFDDKSSGKITKNKFITVDLIDFSKFVEKNCNKTDYIIIRINIEGAEYDLLEHLIETGAIYYFDEIECHWHYNKSFKNSEEITKERQDTLLKQLNKIFGNNIVNKGI